MTEWNEHDLALLAPEVDQDRSRALFDRRRARRRTRRRAGIAVIAMAALGFVCVGGYKWIDRGESVSVETGVIDQPITEEADLPEFEVLEVMPAREEMGTLRAAVDEASLEQLWLVFGYGGPVPDVDFGRWVLVTITIPDDACPPTLTGFDRVGSVLTPVFVETADACEDPLIPKTFVVTIKRSTVTPSFTLRLPPSPSDGYGEQLLEVNVSGGTNPSTTVDLGLHPCVYHDEARVCLDHPVTGGVVALRATGLQVGSELTVQTESDETVYTIHDEGEQIVTVFGAPPSGSTLRVILRGTTATGKHIAAGLRTG